MDDESSISNQTMKITASRLTNSSARDRCPTCGNDTRNTPGIKFKINTKCYHRICETCVDRFFSSGKAECPIGDCHKQLWKREWRTQTFEDLKIEREVEIRRKVTKTYGVHPEVTSNLLNPNRLDRKEEEFETKRDYDDFLELREELIMNLVLNMDVPVTNKKLRDYQIANGIKTEQPEDGIESRTKSVRRKDGDAADPSGLIKGLKRITLPARKAPYDPFMGMPRVHEYYELRTDYESSYDQYKTNQAVLAGGYDFDQCLDESLLRAFAGLGVFIEDEKSQKDIMVEKASLTCKTKLNDDVF